MISERAMQITTATLLGVVVVIVTVAVSFDRMVEDTHARMNHWKVYHGMWSVCASGEALVADDENADDKPGGKLRTVLRDSTLCSSSNAWLGYMSKNNANVRRDAAYYAAKTFSVIVPILAACAAIQAKVLPHGHAATFGIVLVLMACTMCLIILYATWYGRNSGKNAMVKSKLGVSSWLYVASLIIMTVCVGISIIEYKHDKASSDAKSSFGLESIIPFV